MEPVSAIGNGINSLWDLSPIITILVLVIAGLAWFAKSLMGELRDVNAKTFTAFVEHTKILTKFEETLSELRRK